MADELTEYTTKRQRTVIRFFWSEGVKSGEIYGRMTVRCCDTCMSQRSVYEWVVRFKDS